MSILEKFRLDNKVALVTGANRGLGQAMALGLAEAGANIAGISRGDDAQTTRNQVEIMGRRYQHFATDLGSIPSTELTTLVERIVQEFGRLDILVNNAGTIRRGLALEVTEQDWDEVLQLNLKVSFFLAQAAARVMAKQGQGKVINVASMLSYQGGVLASSYACAKTGVLGLTRALANEWAPHRINVNAIAPGYMATDLTAVLQEDEVRSAAILARIPAARWGTPEDLQGAVVFLASAASDYVHGSAIPVDGGWLAR